MIHFLVLDRAWLGRLHGVKKLKLHKQNDLDTKKKPRKIQGKIAAVRFMTVYLLQLRYEVREKKESGKPTRQTDWPMAANQSIVFEDSRGAKEKVLLENLDKRRNCQKDEGQLNHFLPLTSEFMTPLLSKVSIGCLEMPPDWCRKAGGRASLFQSLKKAAGCRARKEKKRLSKANRKGLKSKKNFC